MSTTYATDHTASESNSGISAETMAPEAMPDPGAAEAGVESGPSDAGINDRLGHERMANTGGPGAVAAADEGGTDSESGDEAGAESDFESGTDWSPDGRFPTESAAEEAVVDAYFAEAATSPEEMSEFFPLIAALIPVIKAAVPTLIGALAQQGASAATRAVAGAAQRAGAAAVQGAVRAAVPRAGQALVQMQQAARQMLALPGVPAQLKPLLQQIVARREFGDGSEAEGIEADPDALARALQVAEVVLGVDDRRRVTPASAAPWNRICHLRIRAANGQLFLGTGFFVNRRTVITAGHCVFMPSQGGWPREIQVSQGRDDGSTPFGTVTATSFRTVRGWAINRRREYDYGAIILPRTYVQRAASFAFAARGDVELKGRKLNLAGYPGDKPPGTMWYHGRVSTGVSSRVITYDIDTAGGQSGSPVWQRQGAQRTVVGIHTNGAQSGNSATRITQPVFANLMAWRQEGE